MGVASLVFGIIALLVSFGGGAAGVSFIGTILGILAIIFGVIGKGNPNNRGVATAGIVLGVISSILGILLTIACVACAGTLGSALGVF